MPALRASVVRAGAHASGSAARECLSPLPAPFARVGNSRARDSTSPYVALLEPQIFIWSPSVILCAECHVPCRALQSPVVAFQSREAGPFKIIATCQWKRTHGLPIDRRHRASTCPARPPGAPSRIRSHAAFRQVMIIERLVEQPLQLRLVARHLQRIVVPPP